MSDQPHDTRSIAGEDLEDRRASRGEFTSPSRLADDWGVHINTVYRDIRKGALRAYRLPGGRFRIRRDDARRYGRPEE